MSYASKAVIVILFSLFLCGNALGNDEERCDLLYVKQIAFTSFKAEDSAILTVTGKDCASAAVKLSIFKDSSEKIFSHEVALYALTATDEADIGSRDVRIIAEQFWEMLGPHSARDLKPWSAPQESYDLFDEIPVLTQEEYEGVRKDGRPYICVQSHYEGADCYWYNQQSQMQLLLKLSN